MTLAQTARGWANTTQKTWELRERPDWRTIKPNHKLNAMKARARIVALGALDAILNAIINNSLHDEFEKAEQERVTVLAEYRRQQQKKTRKPSRRTYYCVPSKEVDGKLTCKIYCKKPTDGNYLKVCAAKKSEARVICDQTWNRQEVAA